MPRFLLASQSPRRKELLSRAGYAFEVIVSDVDETLPQGMTPREAVETLARRKANAVSKQYPGAVVLGCDTVVALGGRILGKPADEAEAKTMLRRLSGCTHTVYSGVCVTDGARETVFHTATDVTFYPLSDDTIAAYVATGEPMDKAGAYGIQGLGCVLVERIAGDYSNVVGLPLSESARVLASFGVNGTISV
jgi:septum formation protein